MPRSTADANARVFLAAFRKLGNITEAAAKAKIDRGMHYRWLEASEKYQTAFAAASEAFAQLRMETVDKIESAALKRARDGVLEPVFYQGEKVGAVRRFPEGTVQFLLRAHKPEKYGAKTEITGPNGGPLEAGILVRFVDAKPTED